MQLNISELNQFYQARLGKIVLNQIFSEICQDNNIFHGRILGIGFANPLLEKIPNAVQAISFHPFTDEFLPWPKDAPNRAIYGQAQHLPFDDEVFDCIIGLHFIEEAESPNKAMREIWRVLKPEGKFILINANRSGAYARIETTPFAHGRPFSLLQSKRILQDAMFETKVARRILFTPPFDNSFSIFIGKLFEKIGAKLWPALGGLNLLIAKKVLFSGTEIKIGVKKLKKVHIATYFSAKAQKTNN